MDGWILFFYRHLSSSIKIFQLGYCSRTALSPWILSWWRVVKHLAAYLLASLSGSEPSAATVKKILSAVGVEADAERLEKMIGELSGKDLQAVRATVGWTCLSDLRSRSSPKVPPSWLPFPQCLPVRPLLLVVPLLVVLLLRKRRRKKRLKKNRTMTWASVCSTKHLLFDLQ